MTVGKYKIMKMKDLEKVRKGLQKELDALEKVILDRMAKEIREKERAAAKDKVDYM